MTQQYIALTFHGLMLITTSIAPYHRSRMAKPTPESHPIIFFDRLPTTQATPVACATSDDYDEEVQTFIKQKTHPKVKIPNQVALQYYGIMNALFLNKHVKQIQRLHANNNTPTSEQDAVTLDRYLDATKRIPKGCRPSDYIAKIVTNAELTLKSLNSVKTTKNIQTTMDCLNSRLKKAQKRDATI